MQGDYKCDIYAWEFVIATLLVLIITIITTFYHTLKVSLTNPVEALRYE
jgi:putative ABC transport system permease protein